MPSQIYVPSCKDFANSINLRDIFTRQFTLWDKLILGLFALIIFDTTFGFDTELNRFTVITVANVSLRPQEILMLLAFAAAVKNPERLKVLFKTTIGHLLIAFFFIVIVWATIRIIEGDASAILIRTYFGWIGIPIALIILLEKWDTVIACFLITVYAGFTGAVIMWATFILGVPTINILFPHIGQRAATAFSDHIGFIGQSYTFIQVSIYFATASLIIAVTPKQRLYALVTLAAFLILDVITMGRGRFIFNIFFLVFGIVYIAQKMGFNLVRGVRVLLGVTATAVILLYFIFSGATGGTLIYGISERFYAGKHEISTGSGSYESHYLSVLNRAELLKEDGYKTLLFGAGPNKDNDTSYMYVRDGVLPIHHNALRAVTSDSAHATLIGWYGSLGFILMMMIGWKSYKIFIRSQLLDARFKYVGAMASIFFLFGGIFVADSASALSMASLVPVWAAYVAYYEHPENNI